VEKRTAAARDCQLSGAVRAFYRHPIPGLYPGFPSEGRVSF